MPDWSALAWYEWGAVVVYFFCLTFILLYSAIQFQLVWRYRKARSKSFLAPSKAFTPKVTVQLPLYNEMYVARRLIDATAQLEYPKDKLEIQVLDDSTDETVQIVDQAVKEWKELGIDIKAVRRPNRNGYKAGALAHGLACAKGELVAIFDADFLPRTDFLKQCVPHFHEADVGVVQTRWEHLNEDYSLMTTLQAFGLNAHFTVEQGGRNASNCFINFNGTAGVWRKSCIEDAGGWSSDTLTEDLDLSYRAQLKGWRFVYREDVGSPAELPAAMNALKTQQFRWTKGAAECTVKNLPKVWRSSSLAFNTKMHALFHLMNSFIFICVFVTAVLSVALLFIKQKAGVNPFILVGGSLFLFSLVFLISFYWQSFRHMHPDRSVWAFIGRFILFLSMSMGMSLHNAIAVFEGYVGRKTPFVRTPKFNIVEGEGGWRGNIYLHRRISWLTWLELGFSVFFSFAVVWSIQLGDYGLLPFHILLAFGFGLVGGWSAKQALF